MKKFLLSLAIFILLLQTTTYAAPVFFSWGGETITKVATFPNTTNFSSVDGKHFDAGFRYKQVDIFFIPVWNYDIKWCGYISDKYYIDLTDRELAEYASMAGVQLPTDYPLSFWEKIGGKLLFMGLLIGWIVYRVKKPSEEETPAKNGENTAAEQS